MCTTHAAAGAAQSAYYAAHRSPVFVAAFYLMF
jgi:hypothetical protein